MSSAMDTTDSGQNLTDTLNHPHQSTAHVPLSPRVVLGMSISLLYAYGENQSSGNCSDWETVRR